MGLFVIGSRVRGALGEREIEMPGQIGAGSNVAWLELAMGTR